MSKKEQQLIFDSWIRQHKALLFKVVRSYAFTAFDQEELFQEIIIQVWNSIPKFREESAITTWLYRVSLNTAMRWTSKERKHRDGQQSIDSVEHILHENIKHQDDRLTWLYEEIAKLNEVDRSLALLLLDGFSYKEMSNMLGITESNIGVKIHRIKNNLITKSKKYDSHGI